MPQQWQQTRGGSESDSCGQNFNLCTFCGKTVMLSMHRGVHVKEPAKSVDECLQRIPLRRGCHDDVFSGTENAPSRQAQGGSIALFSSMIQFPCWFYLPNR